MNQINILSRPVLDEKIFALVEQGVSLVMARIFATRNINHTSELNSELTKLIPPANLLGVDKAATLLANAFFKKQKILVVADYDCDGATACAVAVRGLCLLSQAANIDTQIEYLVPNRFKYGYGLTPEIVELAKKSKPDLLVTVDNGIASIDGVDAANAYGISVLITDHHLPADTLPNASAIVNPNQPDCTFGSKNLAGVGVIFYVLLALRAKLRQLNALKAFAPLDRLLPLVALGTIADVVKLDQNNRILVAQGIKRIRAGVLPAGIAALLKIAQKDISNCSSSDLGFAIGPRINAAGRLSDMSLGIACLLTDDYSQALNLASQLDLMNKKRKSIEVDMQAQALNILDEFPDFLDSNISINENKNRFKYTLCAFHPEWHQGVIGILASRLKEHFHRPTIVFALDDSKLAANFTKNNIDSSKALIKGSGRSIPGFNLRDALDLVSKKYPDIIKKFGGHAMAAGLTLSYAQLDNFKQAFEEISSDLFDSFEGNLLERVCQTDGDLAAEFFNVEFIKQLDGYIWGHGFPEPVFASTFTVEKQDLLKNQHLRLQLCRYGQTISAIWFNRANLLALSDTSQAHIAYRLKLNTYRGIEKIQLLIEFATCN